MRRMILAAGTAVLLAGCGSGSAEIEPVAAQSPSNDGALRTDLRDAGGKTVGTVRVSKQSGAVRIVVALNAGSGVSAGFHGLHLHANNDPANGTDCVADAAAPATDWFVSADGHYQRDGQTHGSHSGDLPSISVGPDGSGALEFLTHEVTAEELTGKAVVLHAGRDNFANVPVGTAPDQYVAGAEAEAKTAKSGNAGDRVACGVLGRG